ILFSAPTANVLVNTGTFADPLNTAAVQTMATINGNLDFASTPATFTINSTGGPTLSTQLLINGVVNGSGPMVKAGGGELLMQSASTMSGALNILSGTFAGIAQPSGNALISGPVTLTGGAIGVRSKGSLGSGTVSTLIFAGDTIEPSRLVVDATAG